MKVLLIVFLFVILFGVSMFAEAKSLDASEPEKDSVNHPLYTLEVPRDLYSSSSPVFVFGPEESGFRVNLNVLVQEVGEMTLDEYTKVSDRAAAQLDGYELVSNKKRIIGGREWREHAFKFRQTDIVLESKAVWTIKNRKAIVATYTSLETTFKKHEARFDQVIDSIVLKASTK
jgi:hypothetical protein